ncbi:hypothetical protein [Microbacterium panaciterrae]
MDVIGKDPISEVGRYFRNNVWWWRPLATYIVQEHTLLAVGCSHWQSNSGDGLNAEQSQALADALDADLASGKVAQWAAEYAAEVAALPRETCWLCEGTGVRTDDIGVQHGFNKPRDPETGRGGCNGCSGIGTTEPPAASYPFDVDNVREFATFVRASGGFEIW